MERQDGGVLSDKDARLLQLAQGGRQRAADVEVYGMWSRSSDDFTIERHTCATCPFQPHLQGSSPPATTICEPVQKMGHPLLGRAPVIVGYEVQQHHENGAYSNKWDLVLY